MTLPNPFITPRGWLSSSRVPAPPAASRYRARPGAAAAESPLSLLPVLALTTVTCPPAQPAAVDPWPAARESSADRRVLPGGQWLSFGRLRSDEHLLPILT